MMILGNQYAARRSTTVTPPAHITTSRTNASDSSGSNGVLNNVNMQNALAGENASSADRIYHGRASTVQQQQEQGPMFAASRPCALAMRQMRTQRTPAGRKYQANRDRFSVPAYVRRSKVSVPSIRITTADVNNDEYDVMAPQDCDDKVTEIRCVHTRTPPTSNSRKVSSVSKKASTATFSGSSDRDDTLNEADGEAEYEEQYGNNDDYDVEDEMDENGMAEGTTDTAAKPSSFPVGLKLFFLFLLYYGILSIYTLLGGLLMRALELPYETEVRATSERHNTSFLEYVRNQTLTFWNETEYEDFKRQLDTYLDVYKHQIRCGYSSEDERWSLINSMFYVGTLFTTIGYGQIAPVTRGGRIMTVIISLIGIPLLMLNVAHLGLAISHFIQVFKNFLRRKLNWSISNDVEGRSPQQNIPLPVVFFVIVVYILGMAWIVAAAEDWPFVDAVYFTFITLATIGLGDLVPDHPLLLLVFSVFIVVGLTLVTMFIEVFGLQLERRLVSLRRFARAVVAKSAVLYKSRHGSSKGTNQKDSTPTQSPIDRDKENKDGEKEFLSPKPPEVFISPC